MSIFPCKDCTERKTDCHVSCKRYLKQKMKHDIHIKQVKEAGKTQREITSRIIEHMEQRAKKTKGRRVGQR